MEKGLIVEFEDATPAEAASMARELQQILLDADPSVSTELIREEGNAQDLGSILAVLLGAKAVVVVAKGIVDYLKLRRSASIRIKCKGGEVIAAKLTAERAIELAKLISERC
jgi:hypothetical protein